ncbi:hypothetical protein ACS0TY_028870 [Phlomoides rotata]
MEKMTIVEGIGRMVVETFDSWCEAMSEIRDPTRCGSMVRAVEIADRSSVGRSIEAAVGGATVSDRSPTRHFRSLTRRSKALNRGGVLSWEDSRCSYQYL